MDPHIFAESDPGSQNAAIQQIRILSTGFDTHFFFKDGTRGLYEMHIQSATLQTIEKRFCETLKACFKSMLVEFTHLNNEQFEKN